MLTGHVRFPPADPYAIPAIRERKLTVIKGRPTPQGFEPGDALAAELVQATADAATFGPCQAGELYIVELRDCADANEPPAKPTHAGSFAVDAHIGDVSRVVGAGHLDCWFAEA